MKINSQTPNEDVQVQLIPLIDVIFCILTFFILSALQFSQKEAIKAINLDLPKASTATSSPAIPGENKTEPQRLIVHISPINQLYVIEAAGQREITREQLPGILENYLKQNPGGTLLLNASRTAQYNDVIETLNVLRQVGGDRVSLGVIQDASTPEQPINPTTPVNPFNPGTSPQFNNPQPGVPPNSGTSPQLNNSQPVVPVFPQNIPGTQPGQSVNPQVFPNSSNPVPPVQSSPPSNP